MLQIQENGISELNVDAAQWGHTALKWMHAAKKIYPVSIFFTFFSQQMICMGKLNHFYFIPTKKGSIILEQNLKI